MYVRVVTFQLAGVTPAEYEAHCEEIADVFVEWPGLIAKVWLSDVETNTFGGVYLFDSKDSADLSRSADLFVRMISSTDFTDIEVREYHTVEAATAVTARSLCGVSSHD